MSWQTGDTNTAALDITVQPSDIASALQSDDAEQRRQAVSLLAQTDPLAAVPLLIQALGDTDWRVRKEATHAGRELVQVANDPPPILIDALLTALKPSDNVGLRNAAIDVLGSYGKAATLPLKSALPHLDADGRKLAVEALSRTRDPAAIEVLETALQDVDDNVRHVAIEAIASLGLLSPDEVLAILLRCLHDRDRIVRLTALHGLNALEAIVPWEFLAPLLHDPLLRAAALCSAALSASPQAPAALVQMLAIARGSAFSQAITALARLADGPLGRDVVDTLQTARDVIGPRLVDAANTTLLPTSEPPSWRGPGIDPLMERSKALLLASIANAPGATEAALKMLSEPMLVETAQRALQLIGVAALPEMHAYLVQQNAEPEQLAALVDVAAQISRERSVPAELLDTLNDAFRKAAKSPSTVVATSALYALGKTGVEQDLLLAAEQTLATALPVSHAAETALAGLCDRYPAKARALGHDMMQSERTYLPAAIVIEALGNSDPEALTFLMHAAAAGDARARRSAVMAAAATFGSSALEVLSFALADEDREVRLVAARALGRLYSSLSAAQDTSGVLDRLRELLALAQRTDDLDIIAQLQSTEPVSATDTQSDTEQSPNWTLP